MDPEVENMRFEVKGALFQLTTDKQICDFLEMSGTNWEKIIGKTRNALVSHIIQYIERDELSELEDEGMSDLLSLMDMIKTLQEAWKNDTSENTKDNEEQEKLKKELEQLKLMVQQRETEMQERVNRNTKSTVNNEGTPNHTASSHANSPQWRKDSKISGQIGKPGQKDRLTFSSLAHQIENGLSKCYPESEIVDAVIRAIVPGLQLRSYR